MSKDFTAEAVESVTASWQREAISRRRLTHHDPVADTLEYCAGEIMSRLRAVARDTELLTVEQFAALPEIGVTPQTVRTWIRTHQLAATPGPRGYRIRRDAQRMRRAS